jgi:C_GCAxxG_C_C family probable redox protein
MTREEKAVELFKKGYNCAQSVVGAYCDLIGMTEEQATRAVSAFGGGFGRLREVCGAVSGMTFVLGCLYGYSDPKSVSEKKELYALEQKLAGKFREKEGSIICRELLGKKVGADTSPEPSPRTEEYYRSRGCAGCVACAAGILENHLKGTGRA